MAFVQYGPRAKRNRKNNRMNETKIKEEKKLTNQTPNGRMEKNGKCDVERARARARDVESNIKRKSKNNSFYENNRLEMENGMRLHYMYI